ncbi:MAG TPA: endonuclease/exonuclease/phosphatase family protein [Kofleriaceae bacterium]|jgi:endonuclease/exonuclease/phosphatase family metal-dependent hydrolase|nr:endonuclease/exonuclease/phosphatase family protein [Kofleriaceae bacterium]
MQRLRVMTYNIHAARGLDMRVRSGGKPARLARIADVIKSAKPDLVALQEVDVGRARSGAMDMASELATMLGMDMRFVPCIEHGTERYGICTLSSPSLPILESRELRLPRHHDREQRCALITRHAWDGGEVELLNAHLSVIFRERPHQVAAIAQEMLGEALVIAGDFNMTPWSSAYKVLRRGLTSATRFARTWPAPAPLVPLDHILYRGRLELIDGRAWTEGGARRASDHLPVVAELEHLPMAA